MNKKMLPYFYDVLEVKHYIKGRMRIEIKILKENQEKIEFLYNNLKEINGITYIETNIMLGTVLIKFNEEIINPITLIGLILHLLGLEEEVFNKKNGKIFSFMKDTIDAIDFTIYNKSKGFLDIKGIISAIFICYGIKKLKTNPVMPNGVNLIWWGYSLLNKGGK